MGKLPFDDVIRLPEALDEIVANVKFDTLWIVTVPVFVPALVCFWMNAHESYVARTVRDNDGARIARVSASGNIRPVVNHVFLRRRPLAASSAGAFCSRIATEDKSANG